MKTRFYVAMSALAATLSTSAFAVPSADFSLTAPDPLNPGHLQVAVNFDSDGDADAVLMFVQFAIVEAAPGALTSNGTDYSGLPFTDALPIGDGVVTPGWVQILNIGDIPGTVARVLFQPDPATFGLTHGTHVIGTLDVNFAGLIPGSTVELFFGQVNDSLGTIASFQSDPNVGDTEALLLTTANNGRVSITVPQQQQPAVPEPATATLAAIGVLAVGARRRAR